MRATTILLTLATLLTALSACGQDAEPQASAAEPTPTARPPAASQASAPTPAPPAPTPSPALRPMPAAFSPGDRSDASQGRFEAPGFSLATGFGERVTLEGLLADHEAVALVFYRGFF